MPRTPAPAKTRAPRAARRADAVLSADAPPVGPAGGSALYNPVTGVGVWGRDSATAFRWRSPRRLSAPERDAITVEGIGRRGVSIRGWEATREWGKVQAPRSPLPGDMTAMILAWLEQRAEHLHLRERAADLERVREVEGDAAMLRTIGDDPGRWAEPAPAATAGVEATRVRSLRVLRGHERDYRPTEYHGPASSEWGEASEITIPTLAIPANPEDEHLWGQINLRGGREVRVHASRFHRLRTVDGRSDLDGVQQRLAELLAAGRGAARVAARPAIPWHSSKNMGAQLKANRARAQSRYGQVHDEAGEDAPILLDAAIGEAIGYAAPPGGYDVIGPITGLGFLLSAAWGIPMTLLFGMSPGGLQSPGDAERDNWHNVIRKVQAEITPAILEVYRALAVELAATLLALAAADDAKGDAALAAHRRETAGAVAKLDLAFSWAPLRVLDATEEADWRLKTAQWQQIYLDRNVIRADEIRSSVFGGGGFSANVATVEKAGADTVQKSIPVGVAQAGLSTLIAAAAGQISGDAARALLIALDPGFAPVAATLPAGQAVPNPAPAAGPAGAGPAGAAPAVGDGPSLPDVWTEPEIRKALRVGTATVARWVGEGKIRPIDVGNGRRRYRKAEVIAMWEGDPTAQAEAEAEVAKLDALEAAEAAATAVASGHATDPAQAT